MSTATTPSRFLALANSFPIVAIVLLCTLFCAVKRSHNEAEKSTNYRIMITQSLATSQPLAWSAR